MNRWLTGLFVLGLAAASQPGWAQGSAATPEPAPAVTRPDCETVQSDRLIAGGPMVQSHAVDLLRCGTEYRMRLVRTEAAGQRDIVAELSLGAARTGAVIELAGGACLLAGRPVLENLVIHGDWRKRKRIRFGAGLLGAWIPDAQSGAIRALDAGQKLVCQADSP